MDNNEFRKQCMGIVNQLYDLADVPVDKRQKINDMADKYLNDRFLDMLKDYTNKFKSSSKNDEK